LGYAPCTISVKGSKYGYKRENIYYFENGTIKEL